MRSCAFRTAIAETRLRRSNVRRGNSLPPHARNAPGEQRKFRCTRPGRDTQKRIVRASPIVVLEIGRPGKSYPAKHEQRRGERKSDMVSKPWRKNAEQQRFRRTPQPKVLMQ